MVYIIFLQIPLARKDLLAPRYKLGCEIWPSRVPRRKIKQFSENMALFLPQAMTSGFMIYFEGLNVISIHFQPSFKLMLKKQGKGPWNSLCVIF